LSCVEKYDKIIELRSSGLQRNK